MTWLLVTISPSAVMITPEPVDSPAVEVAPISTIARATALATPATVPVLLCETVVPLTTRAAVGAAGARVGELPTAVAVPPPTTAAATATAASRATGRLARRPCPDGWGAGCGSP